MKTVSIPVPTAADLVSGVKNTPDRISRFRYNRKVAKMADLAEDVNSADVKTELDRRATRAAEKAFAKAEKAQARADKAQAQAQA